MKSFKSYDCLEKLNDLIQNANTLLASVKLWCLYNVASIREQDLYTNSR